jgi:hypothetical protein
VLADDQAVLVEEPENYLLIDCRLRHGGDEKVDRRPQVVSMGRAGQFLLDGDSAKRFLVAKWQPVEGLEEDLDEGLVLLSGAGPVQQLEDDRRTCNYLAGLLAVSELGEYVAPAARARSTNRPKNAAGDDQSGTRRTCASSSGATSSSLPSRIRFAPLRNAACRPISRSALLIVSRYRRVPSSRRASSYASSSISTVVL